MINIPFVYLKKNDLYEGFIPGFVMRSVKGNSVEECRKGLIDIAKKQLKSYKEQNKILPMFPTNEQIIEDFSPAKIERATFN